MPDAYFAPEQGVYSGNDRHTFNLFMWPARALRQGSAVRGAHSELWPPRILGRDQLKIAGRGLSDKKRQKIGIRQHFAPHIVRRHPAVG